MAAGEDSVKSPKVVIGLPSYNHAAEAKEAIESILGQTYADLSVVVVDDCSDDSTYEILQSYASIDPRVVCERNERRVGMIENWRRAFVACRTRFPDAEYFAWGSDHDLWHPRWLSALVGAIESSPAIVLAYPLNTKVTADGGPVDRKPWLFDTAGVKSPRRRLEMASWNMSAGNMIYGLFRARAVERAGVFRRLLVPDRMLLAELALLGEFKQVPQVLWFRRWYGRIFSLGRQRRSFFPEGFPAYAYLPWWLNHSGVLAWNLGVQGTGRPAIGRQTGWLIAFRYLQLTALLHTVQSIKGAWLALVGRLPSLRRGARQAGWAAKGALRRVRLGKLKSAARKMARRVRRQGSDVIIRRPGVQFLKGIRAIPIVRDRAIPWLIRQDIDQIPAGLSVASLRQELAELAQSDKKIVVGPFLSEVGFELLYWIPFLRWVQQQYGIAPERMTAISRGGAGLWYRGICSHYVDLLGLMSMDEYRRLNEERWKEGGNQKQFEVTDLEREILSLAKLTIGDEHALMHPMLMNRVFRHYWFDKAPFSVLKQHTAYTPLPRPARALCRMDLPANYVAVRFYFRESFPDTASNRAFVASIVKSLSAQSPVVVLNTGLRVDDHTDCDLTGSGIYHVDHLMTPTNNLAVQSAIIANARAFVGTYGGLSYLGPFYGVPSVAFYSDPNGIVATHLDMTHRLSRMMSSPLVTLDVNEAGLLRLVLASTEGGPVAVDAHPEAHHA